MKTENEATPRFPVSRARAAARGQRTPFRGAPAAGGATLADAGRSSRASLTAGGVAARGAWQHLAGAPHAAHESGAPGALGRPRAAPLRPVLLHAHGRRRLPLRKGAQLHAADGRGTRTSRATSLPGGYTEGQVPSGTQRRTLSVSSLPGLTLPVPVTGGTRPSPTPRPPAPAHPLLRGSVGAARRAQAKVYTLQEAEDNPKLPEWRRTTTHGTATRVAGQRPGWPIGGRGCGSGCRRSGARGGARDPPANRPGRWSGASEGGVAGRGRRPVLSPRPVHSTPSFHRAIQKNESDLRVGLPFM